LSKKDMGETYYRSVERYSSGSVDKNSDKLVQKKQSNGLELLNSSTLDNILNSSGGMAKLNSSTGMNKFTHSARDSIKASIKGEEETQDNQIGG
jgi:hypothetical protein